MSKGGRPRKPENEKAKPTDRIECSDCGGIYTRNNRTAHNQTKIHKLSIKNNNKYNDLVNNLLGGSVMGENDKVKYITRDDLRNNAMRKSIKKKLQKMDEEDNESYEQIDPEEFIIKKSKHMKNEKDKFVSERELFNTYILNRYGNLWIPEPALGELKDALNDKSMSIPQKFEAIDITYQAITNKNNY